MNFVKIIWIGLILSTVTLQAQYRNPYGGGMGGMRNNGMPYNQSKPSKPSPEQIEKERAAQMDKYMEKLKTELNLDELQYIAVKNDLSASTKTMEIVMKSENSEEDKAKEMKAIQEKTQKSIKSYLNASQKEKYEKLQVEGLNHKPEKGKKNKEKEVTKDTVQ